MAAVLMAAGTASANPREARKYVLDAIDEVEDASGACRRAVLDDLVEIRDLLKDESEARAALKISRVRQRLGNCPRAVERALRRASDVLEDARADRKQRIQEAQKPPPRATDIPWADFTGACLDQWVMVEVARNRISQKDLDLFGSTFAGGCTNPNGLPATMYYPNGTTAKSGTTWYYPNGTTALSGSTIYYPNGTTARSGDTYYFPNGTTAWTPSTNWYYPNGQLAGSYDAVVNQARQRSGKPVIAAFDHAMLSDVEVYRMFAAIRFVSGR